jgi:hypothetical protein
LSAAVRKLTLIGCDELLTAKVDVILTIGYPAALAARQGTTTIPIVVTEPGGDPIATGSLMARSRPIYRFSRATKVELVLNLKTAKLLRLDVPPALVARADEVIEYNFCIRILLAAYAGYWHTAGVLGNAASASDTWGSTDTFSTSMRTPARDPLRS